MSGYREITVPGEAGRARRPTARRSAVQGDWRSVLAGALRATGTTCRNSPGTVLGSLVGLGAAGFICVNALGYQTHRHPAPILPKLAQKPPPAREATPAVREAAREPVREIARDPVRSEPPQAAPAKPAARDTIGELIRADETTASVTPKASPVRLAAKPAAKETAKETAKGSSKKPEAESDPVLRAQKALSKLGYPVKPDGAMGPGTRAAIEKFERSAKLPVTGEAAGRTLRALMARAGHG
ncbi:MULTISPECIES: peptidoglycan-binding domain-containing protein [unclassified Methylobacterium]|jgi:hypothetical protein|uniref:peptidoglycan-binding domain-containing protein n=1 Tax=unclassified Methylobacterium TaxID=2615210 RepID=UPI00135333FE|nr:peptidoglycan-binding domain-containing protein [Methylobacterium sp. 2A]MWV20488.1 peptidoglycan-binding protein [Methylobacterium sp. 2A]